MSKQAYVAHGENAFLICAYDKKPAKAMKKIANLITELQQVNEWIMLIGINVAYDDEGYYNITATISTAA